MIGSVAGRVARRGAEGLLVEVGGVGLVVAVPATTLATATPGEGVRLHTHLVVREDALALYGFGSLRERELFVALLGVGGIGPKIALAVLSAWPEDVVRRAVYAGDAAVFKAVPGIGPKTAGRIVLELSGSLPAPEAARNGARAGGVAGDADADGDGSDAGASPVPESVALAREALVALGYSAGEAEAALARADGDGDRSVEDLVRVALRGGG